jgi:2-hydroxychromene-2-carboxylate isomerase
MPELDFWCEIASSYTYLAAMRIDALAEARGIRVRWTPFLLGPIFAARGMNTSPFVIDAARGRYMWRDVERTAAALGLPFVKPSVFPRNTVAAARIALVGVERGWGAAFIRAAMRANFGQDREIGAPEVQDELLAELGVDGPAIRAEAESPVWRPRLRAATERAASLGIFGAPTFMVGDEMFFGNDRLEQAMDWSRP